MTNFTIWRSLIDGQEIGAIPDSVVHHWAADEQTYSDGDSVSTLVDSEGDQDLDGIGSPTYRDDGINNEPVIELDGSDDAFYAEDSDRSDWTFMHDGTEAAFIFVIYPNTAGVGDKHLWDTGANLSSSSEGSGMRVYHSGDNYRYRTSDGSDDVFDMEGGGTNDNPQILRLDQYVDGNNARLFLDGNEILSDSESRSPTSDDPTERLNLCMSRFEDRGGQDFWKGYLAEVFFLIEPSESDIEEIESDMSDKYGISI